MSRMMTTMVVNMAGAGIADAESAPASTLVYTLDGRLAGNVWENLPRGIYIINGKKVVR